MRSVVTGQPFWKTEAFWTMTIAVVVPFGWLVPLIRLAYRALR